MFTESLVAGLLIAPSSAGLILSLAWLLIFLINQPLKIILKDIFLQKMPARTKTAFWLAGVFAFLSGILITKVYILSGASFLWMLAAVAPIVLGHLWVVVQEGKKELMAELLGVLSLGAVAASIVLAGGHSYQQAIVLWMMIAVRVVTSVIYVRQRLSQLRDKAYSLHFVMIAHGLGMMVLAIIVFLHLAGIWVLLAGLLLSARILFLYRPYPISAKALGVQEIFVGVIFLGSMVVSIQGH